MVKKLEHTAYIDITKTQNNQLKKTDSAFDENSIFGFGSADFSAPGTTFEASDSQTQIDPKTHDKTFDGEISNITQARECGDCWLVSGVSALNTTDAGKKALKEAIKYDKDGVTIRLKGYGREYHYTYDQIKEITQKDSTSSKDRTKDDYYSNNDTDMVVLEMAFADARRELIAGKLVLNEFAVNDDTLYSSLIYDKRNNQVPKADKNKIQDQSMRYEMDNKILTAGSQIETYYAITGKKPEVFYNYGGHFGDKQINKILDKYMNNNHKDYVLGFGTEEKAKSTITGLDGKEKQMPNNHAYLINEVTEKTVTFTNPHDGKPFTVSREEFVNFIHKNTKFYGCDMSEKNNTRNFYKIKKN